MADYAIGDIQGCFDGLMHLLSKIPYHKNSDRLWFVGDLVNRGPKSLEVLRFIQSLPIAPIITLGNHDLHLLSRLFTSNAHVRKDDTLDDVLLAKDGPALGHWLRKQPILYHDKQLNVVMCHAGIPPIWNLNEATTYAKALEQTLSGKNFVNFLTHMYGDAPTKLTPNTPPIEKLRLICNYFTRMRFCDANGHLVLNYKGTIDEAPLGIYPWFELEARKPIDADIVFGHWAALRGQCSMPRIHPIDTGYHWGGQLTALRLQDMQRFTVSG